MSRAYTICFFFFFTICFLFKKLSMVFSVIAKYITLFRLGCLLLVWNFVIWQSIQVLSFWIFFLNQVLYNLGVSIIPKNNRTRSIIIWTRPEFLNNPNGFYTSPPENPKIRITRSEPERVPERPGLHRVQPRLRSYMLAS